MINFEDVNDKSMEYIYAASIQNLIHCVFVATRDSYQYE